MKLSLLLSALACALASTHAAECTEAQQSSTEIKTAGEAVQSACGSMVQSAMNGANFDEKAFCQGSACLTALDNAIKVMPDCTFQGLDVKKTYADLLDKIHAQCKAVSSMGAPSAAVSTPVVAVAAATAVAVFAQL